MLNASGIAHIKPGNRKDLTAAESTNSPYFALPEIRYAPLSIAVLTAQNATSCTYVSVYGKLKTFKANLFSMSSDVDEIR
jgi:hypothetical protein